MKTEDLGKLANELLAMATRVHAESDRAHGKAAGVHARLILGEAAPEEIPSAPLGHPVHWMQGWQEGWGDMDDAMRHDGRWKVLQKEIGRLLTENLNQKDLLASAMHLVGVTDPKELLTEVARSERRIHELLGVNQTLRSMVIGRNEPPTEEEAEAHRRAGGGWLVSRPGGVRGSIIAGAVEVERYRQEHNPEVNWVALNGNARITTWPVVGSTP